MPETAGAEEDTAEDSWTRSLIMRTRLQVTASVENNHRPEPEEPEGYHPSRHAFITGRPGDLYYCSTLAAGTGSVGPGPGRVHAAFRLGQTARLERPRSCGNLRVRRLNFNLKLKADATSTSH